MTQSQPAMSSGGSLEFGRTAPDFNLPGVDGRNYSLDDYRGNVKALVVVFFCNHCPYAIMTQDRLIALGNEYKDRGVGFVLICANDAEKYPQDSFDNMKKRAEEKGYPFPYLHNEDQSVALAYGAKVTPHIYLFDGDMKLRYRGAIDDNIDNPDAVKRHYLRDAIEAILAGTPDKIADPDTKPVGCSIKWK